MAYKDRTEKHRKIEEILAERTTPALAELLAGKIAEALGFVPDKSIPEEAAAEIYEKCRDRANEWAAAFVRTAKRIGAGDIDEGWMIGWFANAIECADFARKSAAEAALCGPIEPGDVVALKSGGPCMIVTHVTKDKAHCRWYDGTGIDRGILDLSSIRRVIKMPQEDDAGNWDNKYVGS